MKKCRKCKTEFNPPKIGFIKTCFITDPFPVFVLILLLTFSISHYLGAFGEYLTTIVWTLGLILALPALYFMILGGIDEHHPICEVCRQANVEKANKSRNKKSS